MKHLSSSCFLSAFTVLPPILVPRQIADGGLSSGLNVPSATAVNTSFASGGSDDPSSTTTTVGDTTIQDFPSLDDLASSIANSPDFMMSSTEVNSPSPASIGGSDAGGGTFPLTETPPPGYMSEDGDTQEPGDLMSKYKEQRTLQKPVSGTDSS